MENFYCPGLLWGAVPKHDDQIIDPNGQEGESGKEKHPPSIPTFLPHSGQKGRLALILADRSPNQDCLAFVIRPSLFPQRSQVKRSITQLPLFIWLKMSNQECLTNALTARTSLILSEDQGRGGWMAAGGRREPGKRCYVHHVRFFLERNS